MPLDGADAQTLAAARARASGFATRAATSLVVAHGARAVLVEEHAQRLAREAVFLLVFGSRASIKGALLERLGAVAEASALTTSGSLKNDAPILGPIGRS